MYRVQFAESWIKRFIRPLLGWRVADLDKLNNSVSKGSECIRELILNRKAPSGIKVPRLDFTDSKQLCSLPENLQVTHLILNGCQQITELPKGLQCYHLQMNSTGIRALPQDIQVEFKLELRNCRDLNSLPPGLKVGYLDLSECTSLKTLPEGLNVNYLDLTNCTAFEHWPENASVSLGRLSIRGCRRLSYLPSWLTNLAQLDISNCERIFEIPEGLNISSWLDLANTAIEHLPFSLNNVQLRWRSVPIDQRIAFHPETLTTEEILRERNVELRRVLLERCGYERFLHEADARILDCDTDPGGERRLLRVPMENDEDLVCVSVQCPSTRRRYLIRVPPNTRTCRQATAWIAGFDDPRKYNPIIET
jgi:hypothetical protein